MDYYELLWILCTINFASFVKLYCFPEHSFEIYRCLPSSKNCSYEQTMHPGIGSYGEFLSC
jgi:hypothetical protein